MPDTMPDLSSFEVLNFPRPKAMKIRQAGQRDIADKPTGAADKPTRFEVLCLVRKKWVLLEPEEWVRQHLLHYLVELGWPLGRTLVEMPAKFGQARGRIDVAILDERGQPALIAECKAPSIALTQATLDQLGRYQLDAKAHHLIATNGQQHLVWQYGKSTTQFPSP